MNRSHLERQLRRLVIAYSDLSQARGYLNPLIDLRKRHKPLSQDILPTTTSIIESSLAMSFAISYTRPFINSKGDDANPTVPSGILKSLNRHELSLHSTIITHRHSALAHSDSDGFSVWVEDSEYGKVRGILPPTADASNIPSTDARAAMIGALRCASDSDETSEKLDLMVHVRPDATWLQRGGEWMAWSILEKLMDELFDRIVVVENQISGF